MILSLDNLMDATFVRRDTGHEYKITKVKGYYVNLEREYKGQKFGMMLFRSSLILQLNTKTGSFYVKEVN